MVTLDKLQMSQYNDISSILASSVFIFFNLQTWKISCDHKIDAVGQQNIASHVIIRLQSHLAWLSWLNLGNAKSMHSRFVVSSCITGGMNISRQIVVEQSSDAKQEAQIPCKLNHPIPWCIPFMHGCMFSTYKANPWQHLHFADQLRDRNGDQRGVNGSQIKIPPPEAIWSNPKCTPKPSSPRWRVE